MACHDARIAALLALGAALLLLSPRAGTNATLARDSLELVAPAQQTIRVCPSGCDFSSIQKAVDAAGAGAELSVAAGHYIEVVTIGKDLTVRGAGAGLTIVDGNKAGSVFRVQAVARAELRSLTITGGSGTGIVDQGDSGSVGGGVYVEGTADIVECAIEKNIVEVPTGQYSFSQGGGVAVGRGATARMRGCTVAENIAEYGGGVATFDMAMLVVENCTISGNRAGRGGGGILVGFDTATVRSSTIVDNLASPAFGGGIESWTSRLSVANTIVAGNRGIADCDFRRGRRAIDSLGHNIDGGTGCNFVAEGDLANTDPRLLALANNGGSTLTHALQPDSEAIDAGHPDGCAGADGLPLAVDQRGWPRAVDGDGDSAATCDIGAFELQASGPSVTPTSSPTVTPSATSTSVHTATVTRTQGPTSTPGTPTATPDLKFRIVLPAVSKVAD